MCQKMRFILLMCVIVLPVLSMTYLCNGASADVAKDVVVDVPAPPATFDAPDLSPSAPTSGTTAIDMCTQHPPKCSVDEATWSGEPDAWQRTGKKWQWYPGTPDGARVVWEWSAPYSGPNPAYSDHREDHYDDFTNTPDGYPVVTGTAPIAIEWERWGSLENDHRLYQYAGISESLALPVGESDCESGIYYPVTDHEQDYAYSPMAVQRNGVCVEGGYLAAQRTELWGAPYSPERIRRCDDPVKGLPADQSPTGNAVCKLSPHVGVVHQRYAWQSGPTPEDGANVGCEAVVYAWGWPMPEQVDGGQDYEAWFRNGELRFSRWINFSGEITDTVPAPDDHAWWAPRCERAWSETSNWLYDGVYKVGFTVYTDSITLPPTVVAEIPVAGGSLTSTLNDTVFTFPPDTFTDTVIVTQTILSRSEVTPSGGLPDIHHFYRLDAVYSSTGKVAQPTSPYTVAIHYTDEELGAVSEDTLALHSWRDGRWSPESSSVVLTGTLVLVTGTHRVYTDVNVIVATPDHFSTWGVFGKGRRIFLPQVLRQFQHYDPLAPKQGLGGSSNQLAVTGNLVLLSEGSHVAIVDVSDPTQPNVLSRVLLTGWLQDLQAKDDVAYLAMRGGNLTVLDLAQPDAPRIVQQIPVTGTLGYIDLYGDRLFLTGSYGLHIFNISDPAVPYHVSSFATAYDASRTFISGDWAIIKMGYSAEIVDISDPFSPQFLSRFSGGGSIVAVSGNTAYAIDQMCIKGTCGGELHRIDLGDGTNPVIVGTFPESYWDNYFGDNVLVENEFVYVVHNSEFKILDFSDPTQPVVVGSVGQSYADAMFLINSHVIFVHSVGIDIYDVSDKSNPSLEGSLVSGARLRPDICMMDDTIFARVRPTGEAGEYNGFHVIDVQNTSVPQLAVTFTGNPMFDVTFAQATPDMVHVLGSFPFSDWANSGQILRIVSAFDGSDPQVLARYNPPSGGGVMWGSHDNPIAVDGNRVYVPTPYDNLEILDVSDPTQPTLMGTYHPIISLGGVEVDNGLVYLFGQLYQLPDEPAGVKIVDATDPQIVVEVGTFVVSHTNGYIQAAQVVSDVMYLGVRDELQLVYISVPFSPTLITSRVIQPGATIRRIDVGRDRVLVGLDTGRIELFDVSDTFALERTGVYTVSASVEEIKVAGDKAYIATGYGGISVLDIRDPASPTLSAHSPLPAFRLDVDRQNLYVASAEGGLRTLEP